jgi:hypothetical protein
VLLLLSCGAAAGTCALEPGAGIKFEAYNQVIVVFHTIRVLIHTYIHNVIK